MALSDAQRLEPSREPPNDLSKRFHESEISLDQLYSLIGQYGDSMTLNETNECFKTILLEKEGFYGQCPPTFTSKTFIEQILDLETSLDRV